MELIKKNIHMNRQKCRGQMQVTLDNDLNVPDVKPDIKSIITEQGDVKIQEVKVSNGRVLLKGCLMYHMMYVGTDNEYEIQHMNSQIEFEEYVNMNEVCTGDNVQVKWELEDLTTDIINSRKISVKTILNLVTSVEELVDEQVVIDVENDGDVETLDSSRIVTELCLAGKDIYRIKDEVRLPAGRESIREIIYQDVIPEGIETRLLSDQMSIRGDLRIFTLYIGGEEDRINSFETNVSFQGTVDCNGCSESMISQIDVGIQDKDIQVKADEDGEDRILDIEVVLGLDMKVYQEQEINILADMYSTKVHIEPVYKDAAIDNLIIKNNCKVRISDRITIESGSAPVMQVCSAKGNVRIDNKKIVTGGIEVEGVIEVDMIYYTEREGCPVSSYKGMIPFTQLVEAKGINDDCTYELEAVTDSITVMVIEDTVIEVKGVVNLDVIVFERCIIPVIIDWQITDRDMKAVNDMPGVTGYIVKDGDTLWDLAKEFGVTMDEIIEMNELSDNELKKGQKIIIVKKI